MPLAPFVSAEWLKERLTAPDIVVVDGSWYLPAMNRDPEAEYRAGHIPGAVRFDIDTVKDPANSLPHMLPQPDVFAAQVGAMGIGDGMKIVIYDGAGLFSAPRVWWTFKVFGARDVAVLEGGFPAWKAHGGPVEEGEARPRARRTFTARLDHSAVADVRDIQRMLETGSAQVIDARPADRFRGETPEPRPGVRSGHMPQSLNLPFTEIVQDGHLRDPAAITEAMSLGLNYAQMMGFIILPQALRIVIPGIVNTFIGLFKDTTLVAVVGIFDLIKTIEASRIDPNWAAPSIAFTGYAFAALFYFVFCFGMSRYSLGVERRLAAGHNR